MADPFQPKFVDLVRNYTATTGTGNIALGQPVAGHDGLAQSVGVGARFFYCITGVDKPAEREVGRGTMLANGTVAREPVGGALTNFSTGSKTIALVVGADWFTRFGGMLSGGAETLAGLVTSDKSSLVGAVNELAASGGSGAPKLTFASCGGSAVAAAVKLVDTVGYSTAGVGAARYIFDAGVDAAFVAANPRCAFLAGDGRGFKLDPAQRLTIEMFGGRADHVSASNVGTDNLPALMAAVGYKPAAGQNFSATVHLSVGKYYFSDTFEPRTVCRVVGEGGGHDSSAVAGYAATWCYWPGSKTCIRLPSGNTIGEGTGSAPGAQGSVIEGLCIAHMAFGSDRTKHGVQLRTRATLKNLVFENISGNGIHIDVTSTSGGATEGNANGWVVDHCNVHLCGGDGLHIRGNDANAGYSIEFETKDCGGCGIFEGSGLGNVHFAAQIAGYGNGGVHRAGRHYQLIAPEGNAALGSTVVPGTNNKVWFDLGPGPVGTLYPEWVSGTAYRYRMPIYAYGGSNATTFVGGYMEFGSGVRCHLESPAICIGGNWGFTPYSAALRGGGAATNGGIVTQSGIGSNKNATVGTPMNGNIGDYQYTMLGSDAPSGPEEISLLEHRRQKDGEFSMYWYWAGNDQYLRYLNQKPYWTLTGPSTTQQFGRSTPQRYLFAPQDMALYSPDEYEGRRFGGRYSVGAISGEHARGDHFVMLNPHPGNPVAMRTCLTGGTPGTWGVSGAVTLKGATASRPNALGSGDVGVSFLDTTLAAAGKPIWWNGTAWVDAAGAVA